MIFLIVCCIDQTVTSKPTLTLSMLREAQRKAKEEEERKARSLALTAATAAAEVSMAPFYAIMRIVRWANTQKRRREGDDEDDDAAHALSTGREQPVIHS